MTRVTVCLVACLIGAAGGTGRTQAQLVLFDNFNEPRLSPENWRDGGTGALEMLRDVRDGELRLANRSYAETTNDAGTHSGQVFASFVNAAGVTAIQTAVRIEGLRVEGCSASSTPAYADANIFGAFFNAATPVPNSHVNDVTAAIRVSRVSNTTDDAATLRITGIVARCENADCSIADGIGAVALGTVQRDSAVRLRLEWQPDSDRFAFRRGNSADVFVPYAVSDAAAPGNPHKLLGTLAQVPNCTSAPRPFGFVAASFDNVLVNASALP
jgi:hypothetical protein